MTKINKQTLFFYNEYGLIVQLFDLKTLTLLAFNSRELAMEFAKKHNELQCLEDILADKSAFRFFIYLGTEENKLHKMINMQNCKICFMNEPNIKEGIKDNKIINLEKGDKRGKFNIKWLIEQTPKGFEDKIKKEYDQFQANMRLLNNLPDFEYLIIGKYVIVTRILEHNGSCTVPNFVTSISQYAIPNSVKTLRLLDGVEFLGRNALRSYDNLIIEGGG